MKLYFTTVCSHNCHNQGGKLEERCLNSEQIMRFRIDIECAVVQRSSTTTTRIAVPGIDATPLPKRITTVARRSGANQASAASNTLEGI